MNDQPLAPIPTDLARRLQAHGSAHIGGLTLADLAEIQLRIGADGGRFHQKCRALERLWREASDVTVKRELFEWWGEVIAERRVRALTLGVLEAAIARARARDAELYEDTVAWVNSEPVQRVVSDHLFTQAFEAEPQ